MDDPKYRVSEKVLDVGLLQPCVLTASENYVVVQKLLNYDESEALTLHVYNIETEDIWKINDIPNISDGVLSSDTNIQVYINDNIMAACFRTESEDGDILKVWSTISHDLRLENYFSCHDLIDLLFHSSKSMLILLRKTGVQVMQFDSQIFISGYYFVSDNFHDSVSNLCFPFILHSNQRDRMTVWNIDEQKKQIEKHLDINNFNSSFEDGKTLIYNIGTMLVDETIVDVLYVSSTFVVLTEETERELILINDDYYMRRVDSIHKIRILNQNAESLRIIMFWGVEPPNPNPNFYDDDGARHMYRDVKMLCNENRLIVKMNVCYGDDEVYMFDMKDLLSHQRSEEVSPKLLKDLKEWCRSCSFLPSRHDYVMTKSYILSVKTVGDGSSPVIKVGEPFQVKLKKLDFWSYD